MPANRIGHAHGLSAGQLKIVRGWVMLPVLAIFSVAVPMEPPGLRHLGAVACIGARRRSCWSAGDVPAAFCMKIRPATPSRSS